MSTFTITFGDQAENHKGMQVIGKMAERGFSPKDLQDAKTKFQKQGFKCDLIFLNQYIQELQIREKSQQACVLVVKKGVDCILGQQSHNLFDQMYKLNWDQKAFMYGRVVSKHARHNLCFGDQKQQPQYQSGRGRIISWEQVSLLYRLRQKLGSYIKDAQNLTAEGNFYYDVNKCGIGFHGDGERKKVIAFRLSNGKCHPIHYQWFLEGKPIGKRAIIELNDRDLYVMSQKAVGTDWKKKKISTLRHATGAEKFTKIQ